MTEIAANLARIRERIAVAEARYGRRTGSVRLLAVSKGHPAEAVTAAADAGQSCFGENRLQEALPKIAALSGRGLEWHFIGPLQSNKTRPVAEHFDWVHSIDRERIARRLDQQRPESMAPLNVCIQVNISGEASKSGIGEDGLTALVEAVAGMGNLRLRGLMAIPAPATDADGLHEPFRRLARLQAQLLAAGHTLDTLSMGMTADMDEAIAEGATIVRVGTGIFGPRPVPPADEHGQAY